MAAGDLTLFNDFKLALMNGEHDLDTDVIKMAFLDATSTMSASQAAPVYGHANFSEVGTGGNYTAKGVTLTVTTMTTGTTITFDAADPSVFTADVGNDTDYRWALIFNDTHASDAAIGYIDLGTTIDNSVSNITITFNASGIITLS